MSEKIKRFSVRNTSIYPEGMGPGPDFSTLMVRADDHDAAIAAKDARIAELEGLLRYVRESAIYDNTVQAERIDAALSGKQSKPKGCTKPGCFPYCDCGTIDDHVPPTVNPSEDGGEVPEVVGWLQTDATRKPSMWVSRHRQVHERAIDKGALAEPLMTVAQHSRIVAAKDAEIEQAAEMKVRYCRIIQQLEKERDELRAQPARQVGEYGDAYQGAREDLAIWKRRALEAEATVRELEARIDTLILDCQGETRMGEPVIPNDRQVGRDDALDTPGNRNPNARYAGYKGEPLANSASEDEVAAWREGMKAAGNNEPCKGMNCGCTDGRSHSLECEAETAATYAGGVFIPRGAPTAVVMPEPVAYRWTWKEGGEDDGWAYRDYPAKKGDRKRIIEQALLDRDEVAHLNRRAIPVELLERAAYLLELGELDGPTARELRALLGKDG